MHVHLSPTWHTFLYTITSSFTWLYIFLLHIFLFYISFLYSFIFIASTQLQVSTQSQLYISFTQLSYHPALSTVPKHSSPAYQQLIHTALSHIRTHSHTYFYIIHLLLSQSPFHTLTPSQLFHAPSSSSLTFLSPTAAFFCLALHSFLSPHYSTSHSQTLGNHMSHFQGLTHSHNTIKVTKGCHID